jgi:hypothetical protein
MNIHRRMIKFPRKSSAGMNRGTREDAILPRECHSLVNGVENPARLMTGREN